MKRNLLTADLKSVIRTDNGPQFKSTNFRYTCSKLGIHHELIPVKTPNKNAHIEVFHSILQSECLDINEFDTYKDAYTAVVDYINYYNNIRIHSSIRFKTPNEYYLEFINGIENKQVIQV